MGAAADALGVSARGGVGSGAALHVELLNPRIGAQIDGVDLSGSIDDATFEAIRRAWMDHQVLRFRRQSLSKEQLLAFARRFGDLDRAPINVRGKPWFPEHPELAVMSNIVVDGEPIGSLGYGEAVWHTDMSYNEAPPSAALLYAIEVTREGGLTGFLSMYDAFETLPAELRGAVESARIKHDSSRNSAGELRKGFAAVTDPRDAPGAVHPAVVRHPVTGRQALFLGRRPASCIVGLPLDESEDLLNRLWSHVARDELAWWQTWEVGDLVMWDNRCTMHKRTAFDPSERRLMHRAQVRGGPPLA
jgi:taurine dioxygenase